MRAARGFTLLEVLIAVGLLAVVGTLAVGGLRAVLRSAAAIEQEQAQLQALQSTLTRLEADLQQALARSTRSLDSQQLAAFSGTELSLNLVRGGRRDWLAQGRSSLVAISWRASAEGLIREQRDPVDAVPGALAEPRMMLGGARWRLGYLDDGLRSHALWPPEGSQQALPRALRAEIELAPGVRIERLFELPAGGR